jgi:hypothetical protein
MGVNRIRVLLGGLAGGVIWTIWSIICGYFIIGISRYEAAQNAGVFLREPRYPIFDVQWIVMLFVIAVIMACLYAWTRQTLGAGPKTALKVGFLVGFIAGFPLNFANAAWVNIDRMFPLGWMLEMWVGAILATLMAASLYKDPA